MGGGKSGGGLSPEAQKNLEQMGMTSMMSMAARHDPNVAGAFKSPTYSSTGVPGSQSGIPPNDPRMTTHGIYEAPKTFGDLARMTSPGTDLGREWNTLTGGEALPQYQPFTIPKLGVASGARGQFQQTLGDLPYTGSSNAQISSPRMKTQGMVRGAGALSPVPTGLPQTASPSPSQGGKSGIGHDQSQAMDTIRAPGKMMNQGGMGAGMPMTPGSQGKGGHTTGPMVNNQSGMSPRGSYRGAGAMSSIPTGAAPPSGTPQQGGQSYRYQAPQFNSQPYQGTNFQPPQTSPINPLTVNPQMYQQSAMSGMVPIQRATQSGIQDIMRQYGQRGLGRSGLALGAATGAITRGSQEQAGQLGQQLGIQQMGQNFGAAQQAQNLEAQRQQAMAGLGLQSQQAESAQRAQQAGLGAQLAQLGLGTQQSQAAENLARSNLGLQTELGRGQLGLGGRAQSLNESLGMGNLGLQEQAQGLRQAQAQSMYGDVPSSILAGTLQSLMGMGGKG